MFENAKEAQRVFWDRMDQYLDEHGNPFRLCHEKSNGEPYFSGCVNKTHFMNMLDLAIDFKYRDQKVIVQLYIENNLSLYEDLKSERETIEMELGVKPKWNENPPKNPNTRRIQNTFPLNDFSFSSFDQVIEQVVPLMERYMRVFGSRIRGLC